MKSFKGIYNPENIFEVVALQIAVLRSQLQSREEERRKKAGITVQQFNFLILVNYEHPEPVSPGTVKDALVFKTSDLTRLVDRLVKKKLLIRYTNPENRRQVLIQLTDKGHELVTTEVEFAKKDVLRIYEKLTEEEAGILIELLQKIEV